MRKRASGHSHRAARPRGHGGHGFTSLIEPIKVCLCKSVYAHGTNTITWNVFCVCMRARRSDTLFITGRQCAIYRIVRRVRRPRRTPSADRVHMNNEQQREAYAARLLDARARASRAPPTHSRCVRASCIRRNVMCSFSPYIGRDILHHRCQMPLQPIALC